TGLIEKHSEQLLPAPKQASIFTLASLTAAIMARQGQTGNTTNRYANKADPWSATDGWRLSGHYTQHIRVIDNDEARLVTLEKTARGWQLLDNDIGYDFEWQVQITPDQTCHCRLSLNGSNHQATVVMQGEQAHVFENGTVTIIGKPDELQHAADDSDAHGGGLTAPMPGKIISLLVQAGDTVTKGQALLVMEAMKMEHTITAPEDGKVEEVFYAVGDQVTEGVALITVG
ncbi:MAG: biotin/lipoyl-containing protein, partial [Advenella sp.]|nr:biotin/lipoyl-containing protein [Advenella sp.]